VACFLGLDIGTSSVKALLVDGAQRVLATASADLEVSRPRPLWSEQDPEIWWQGLLAAVAKVREAVPRNTWAGLQGIGLSGQQHGAVLLDAAGQVLRPAILWNDGRSAAECAELTRRVPDLTERAGNIAMPGFTAPKLLWVQGHEPDIFAATSRVLLPKDYVRWRLSGAYVSDMSDASGTLWLNVAKRAWDDTILAATGLSRAAMPDLVEGSQPSATLSADLSRAWGVGSEVVIAGGAGDNAASAVGIGATRAGDGFLSLGTSGVLFVATDHYVSAPARTLHGFCHALPKRWHGMSVHLSAASALAWIAGLVGAGADIGGLLARTEQWAADPAHRDHAPLFLPYLSGERTPHNDPAASAMFAGLRAEHGVEALTYAVLEGVAFALADGHAVLLEAGAPLQNCLLVGGGARSRFWAQMLADILGIDLLLPEGAEHGAAFGAARLGMLAAGAGDEASVCTRPAIQHIFTPSGDRREQRLARFRALYPAERATRVA
jgi:xylulokinase